MKWCPPATVLVVLAILGALSPECVSAGVQDESFNGIAYDSGNGLRKEQVEIVVAKCREDTTWLTDMGHEQITTFVVRGAKYRTPSRHIPLAHHRQLRQPG